MAPAPLTLTIRLYKALTAIGAPLALCAARRRFEATNGPMDRLTERKGQPSLARPDGPLIWMHAVSVGEFLSILDLVGDLVKRDTSVLVTTTTTTAADIAAKRLPEGAFHQFAPLDTPQATRRFLDFWAPDLAIFVESEIWPNQILACETRGIPRALINARLSAKSVASWHKRPKTAQALFSRFDRIMCQTDSTRDALAAFVTKDAALSTSGDMKAAAAPLPVDTAEAQTLGVDIGDRPVWVASSTHEGEESIVSAAHGIVTSQAQNALLILAPRHPERGDAIETQLRADGWNVARRSAGTPITPETQVYLADTLGETGLWYHLSPIVLVAGSFAPVGGHNPYEPAHFDCAILHGPLYANFAQAYGEMADCDAALEVEDATALGLSVAGLFNSPRLRTLQDNAHTYVTAAKNNRDTVVQTLLSLRT
ncbi:3-deoxy-D-manno-octulosonic acid transferase [Shimia thalassica]|uniref:3-deoxy-D-manno-octulosonic acid transferase n=1 Tax=Shimia thalassica TaxID=1715693 RepID=A0A0P1IRI4_9RHOB|nr:3-deoxy-D-manno-octulosonic acid transferase [Shimia thalassica]CUJ99909.1 3-deoxy-D-manno-octulosonic acid transferase [Shimia thalassica]